MIPAGYSRNTVYGTLSSGDIFNWSLWLSEAPTDQGATQTQANMLAAAFDTLIVTPGAGNAAPNSVLGSGSAYVGVRVYSYTTTSGHATYIADAGLPHGAGGAAGSNFLPPQSACVVTLKTAAAGRRNMGRVYLPLERTASTGVQLPTTLVANLSGWMAALIRQWNSIASPGKVCVLSQKYGTSQPVTNVKVDSKIDIQRRRANKVIPTANTITVI